MGRPPRLTPEQAEHGRQVMLNAIGIAGWAQSAELMMVLVEQNILTDKAARRIMRGALACIEVMNDITHDPAFEAAHDTLAGQIAGGKKGGKG